MSSHETETSQADTSGTGSTTVALNMDSLQCSTDTPVDHASIHIADTQLTSPDSPSVTYTSNNNYNGIVIGRPTITTDEHGGKAEIQTRHYMQHTPRPEWQRPLTQRYMKVLKCLSLVCAIIFFPTGIPAAFYAWRTRLEFDIGILRGDIDKAQRCAKRSERLMILTVVFTLLVAVLIVAIVERANIAATSNFHSFHPRHITS